MLKNLLQQHEKSAHEMNSPVYKFVALKMIRSLRHVHTYCVNLPMQFAALLNSQRSEGQHGLN